jgi:hypothetical protein
MTYTDTYGQTMVAEGATILSADGSRYMTNQYNGFGEVSRYETVLVVFEGPTATDVVNDNVLAIYPNPTTGVLNFSEKLSNVEVYDVVGRKVYSLSEAETSINVSGLSAGHYLLVANKEGERISVKFVVK